MIGHLPVGILRLLNASLVPWKLSVLSNMATVSHFNSLKRYVHRRIYSFFSSKYIYWYVQSSDNLSSLDMMGYQAYCRRSALVYRSRHWQPPRRNIRCQVPCSNWKLERQSKPDASSSPAHVPNTLWGAPIRRLSTPLGPRRWSEHWRTWTVSESGFNGDTKLTLIVGPR